MLSESPAKGVTADREARQMAVETLLSTSHAKAAGKLMQMLEDDNSIIPQVWPVSAIRWKDSSWWLSTSLNSGSWDAAKLPINKPLKNSAADSERLHTRAA